MLEGRSTVGRMTDRIYRVQGMTCGHCVQAVTAELTAVDGVAGVAVDLESGAVTVSGDGFTDEAVAAAGEETGYELAP